MSSLLRCGGMVRLLAVLWVMARCGASQQQPSAVLNITPDQLSRLIEQAVKVATQPLITKLESRMDTIDFRLYTLDSRLDVLDSRLDVLDSRVDALTVRSYSHDSQLGGLATKVDNQNSRLDGLVTRLDSQQSQLDGLVTKVDSQQSQLDGLVTKVDSQQSQLDVLVTKVDNETSRLDGQASQLDNQISRLDRQASQLDNQTFRLDGLATQLNNQTSRLDGLPSQLDNQTSRLDGLDTKTDSQQTQIDGMTIRLNRVQTALSTPTPAPRDCSDLPAGAQSGVHLLQPDLGRTVPVPAYCDLDTDGGRWTVIQRRADVQPRRDFYLDWQAYKEGFGELDAEFWWGLQHLWEVTSPRDRRYELRISMEDFDGEKRHAVYQGFRISSEAEGYSLAAASYTGDAGDSLSAHIGRKFSTRDRDQDTSDDHCAQKWKGAWWYFGCYDSSLNGPYLSGPTTDRGGINWYSWKKYKYSLKTVEMKIRPTKKAQERK